jgi:hypothetical protein
MCFQSFAMIGSYEKLLCCFFVALVGGAAFEAIPEQSFALPRLPVVG